MPFVVLLQLTGKTADGNNRRFEFVGEAVDKIVSEKLGSLQFVRHAVEAAHQVVQFADDGLLRHPHLEIALSDFFIGGNQPAQRINKELAHKYSQQCADDHAGENDDDRQYERCQSGGRDKIQCIQDDVDTCRYQTGRD